VLLLLINSRLHRKGVPVRNEGREEDTATDMFKKTSFVDGPVDRFFLIETSFSLKINLVEKKKTV